MNYLSVENLSKSYGDKVLFQNISFGLEKGQKIALIAKNGTGKTSLLRILAGQDTPDTGNYSFRKDLKISFLDQNPRFGEAKTIIEAVLNSNNVMIQAIKNYELALENHLDEQLMNAALLQMDNLKAWDFELKIKQILTKLKVGELQRDLATLSGGQRKRIALAKVLIEEPDFLILDEPTNHLDLDMIEWLEEYLGNQQVSLLMVTHDRYFLENVCNEIFEMEDGNLYRYKGNYSYFLEKKDEREYNHTQAVMNARNLMRKELDWIRRQPKARGTKAKYRIDAFQELKKQADKNLKKDELALATQMSRLGKKVIELENVFKNYDDLKILDNFSYKFQPRERVGIVGNNGVGKSTFLNILTGEGAADRGEVVKGETVVFGYYNQEGIQLPEDKRVIEVVTEIAEVINIGKQNLSASQLLERFLFNHKQQYAYVSTLSGGERRRLYLLTILAKNPNFLILDEPTNDLDILTLQVLEDFLANYPGCLLIVTHDRYFMDKLVEHLFVFEGNGKIRDFNGSYSEYRAVKELEEENLKTTDSKPQISDLKPEAKNQKPETKKKLSFKEQKEYETLETEIANLENRKMLITNELSGDLHHEDLLKKSQELEQIIQQIDEKTMRWLELAEYV
ncbi:MAG: ABC-F family ATP-binding cassette domain-containing protein [Microscillaceae bacterium]|jgi:ATP-binding cassette subfamily F protein uup|nr:ABC-F family ATP-binding cassette domain-containing protein [Microscillaceae bacterium]